LIKSGTLTRKKKKKKNHQKNQNQKNIHQRKKKYYSFNENIKQHNCLVREVASKITALHQNDILKH